MFTKSLLAVAYLASCQALENAKSDDGETYDRFAAIMDEWGYTWEPVKVKTDDGFTLTTFHITGNSEGLFTPTLPPVLIQHGDSSDGADWLKNYWDLPMHLQLAEAGYDVWVGNNRGTEYSQVHDKYTVDDKEFWAWSWAEMGIYDDVANIKAIKEHSGAEKVFYLGWSQGTVQMFYALAHVEESFLQDNLYKFVAFAPCTICPPDGDEQWWTDTLFNFDDIGVYDLYGPNYWDSEYPKICDQLGSEACDYANCDWCQPMSVQSEQHWWQNTYTNRFQEFAPNYDQGERETALIDLAGIDKVPIAMIVGTADQTCPYDRAVETAGIIGDMVVHFESIEGEDHGYFGSAASPEFMDIVFAQLQIPDTKPKKQDKAEAETPVQIEQ